MTPKNQEQRVQEILWEALKLSGDARVAYLEKASGGDSALRREVESLLEAEGQAGTFLFPQPQKSGFADPLAEKAGDHIGRYKLLEKIGEGGFGVVWMAEQEEPVRRRVALKIIKLGMDTREVVMRFEGERQALAMMDHPNIARVLDAGATPAGRPYFVMELINGPPITEFCDREQLCTQARLRLFIKVCHAVQHAHQKGIIHRDLKPTNVLVTVHDAEPVPKVIDFGVAKALGHRLACSQLSYRSPPGAEALFLVLTNRSWSVRHMACAVLVRQKAADARVVAALENLAREPEAVEYAKTEAATQDLVEKLTGDTPEDWSVESLLKRARDQANTNSR